MGWDTFWATFSLTNMATLQITHQIAGFDISDHFRRSRIVFFPGKTVPRNRKKLEAAKRQMIVKRTVKPPSKSHCKNALQKRTAKTHCKNAQENRTDAPYKP
jgi:hypothetical protein